MILVQYQSENGNNLALYLVSDELEHSIDPLIKKAEATAREIENLDDDDFDPFSAVDDYLTAAGFLRTHVDNTFISDYL